MRYLVQSQSLHTTDWRHPITHYVCSDPAEAERCRIACTRDRPSGGARVVEEDAQLVHVGGQPLFHHWAYWSDGATTATTGLGAGPHPRGLSAAEAERVDAAYRAKREADEFGGPWTGRHPNSSRTECLECGAGYSEPGHVDEGGLGCDRCDPRHGA